MTVRELIKKLERYDDDAEVIFQDASNDGSESPITIVEEGIDDGIVVLS